MDNELPRNNHREGVWYYLDDEVITSSMSFDTEFSTSSFIYSRPRHIAIFNFAICSRTQSI